PVRWCGRLFAMWGADVVRLDDGSTDESITSAFLGASKSEAPFDVGLITAADVLITDRTDDDLRARGVLDLEAPRLVVLRYSDFGSVGPYATYASADIVLQALTGYLSVNGKPGRPPLKAPSNVVAYACGTNAFVGVLAALLERDASQRGQTVTVAGIEAVASLVHYTRTEYFAEASRRKGGVGPPMFRCSDG